MSDRQSRSRFEHAADGVFSAFVHSIAAEGWPEDKRVREVLAALEGILRQELRERGLWHLPPVRLGVIGYTSWAEPGALAELAADAFEAVILRRLHALFAQLRVKPHIEGLVRLNVRWFLHDLQRSGDPLGYRAWEVTRRAAERAVESGALTIVGHRAPIDAGTRLATGRLDDGNGSDDLELLAGTTDDERSHRLRMRAANWNNQLLPDLITAGGRQLDTVVERFAQMMPQLAEDGIHVFRLRDVVVALRDDLRPQWAARLWEAGALVEAGEIGIAGESEPPLPVLRLSALQPSPEEAIGEREAFQHLSTCVAQALGELEDARTANEVVAVWRTLVAMSLDEERLPSSRQLAHALNIPRGRMPELFRLIRRALSRCREDLGLGLPADATDPTEPGA